MDTFDDIKTSTARKNFLKDPDNWILAESTDRVRVYEFHHFGVHLAKIQILTDYTWDSPTVNEYLPPKGPEFRERGPLYELKRSGGFGIEHSYTSAALQLERAYKTIMNGGKEEC